MRYNEPQLKHWIETLSIDELKKVCYDTVSFLIETEDVNFYDDNTSPYWDSCGDRLDGKLDDNF